MATSVDTFNSTETVISGHFCLRKMKKVISDCCENASIKDINKIFARFIISSKTLGCDTHSVIPEFTHKESVQKFEKELIDKFHKVDIPRMRNELSDLKNEYIEKMQSDKGRFSMKNNEDAVVIEYAFSSSKGSKGSKSTKGTKSAPGKTFKKGVFEADIPNHIFDKLAELCENKTNNIKYIYCVWIRYIDITCGGMDTMQWCCSEDIFSILINEFGCKVELFASPINCHPNMLVYGSLFHDTDRHFGSLGNYQGIIAEKRLSGLMYAHPPPIELLQNDFVARALAEMTLEDRPLGFFAMLAYWADSAYYINATKSQFCRRVILPSAYKKDHEDLAEAYFTSYSPIFNKDIPMAESDRAVIVILANDLLWQQQEFRDKLDEHFPAPESEK